jgi:uncharacterized damage-inducible protein DinB
MLGGVMVSLPDLMAYDRWANHQYLDVISMLDEEQFTQNLVSSYPSVRETLLHLAWAEWLWVERWQGRSPKTRIAPEELPKLSNVRSYLKDVEDAQVRFLQGLPPGGETQRIRYTNIKGEEWEYNLEQMVNHLVIHSAYHRGQLATMLRQLGAVPPTTDYLVFLDAQKNARS